MKYVAIDIETTGLDPETCQVLQIGAVIEDTGENVPIDDLPTFMAYIAHEDFRGSAYALHMNSNILGIIAEGGDRVMLPIHAVYEFQQWLIKNGYEKDAEGKVRFLAAGKNVGSFDEQFLKKMPIWNDILHMSHEKIDPAMLFVDWSEDEKPPNLQTCLQKAGIDDVVTHDAVEDAQQVIKLIRYKVHEMREYVLTERYPDD